MAVDLLFLFLAAGALAATLYGTFSKAQHTKPEVKAWGAATVNSLCMWVVAVTRLISRRHVPEPELIPIALAATFAFTAALLAYGRVRAGRGHREGSDTEAGALDQP